MKGCEGRQSRQQEGRRRGRSSWASCASGASCASCSYSCSCSCSSSSSRPQTRQTNMLRMIIVTMFLMAVTSESLPRQHGCVAFTVSSSTRQRTMFGAKSKSKTNRLPRFVALDQPCFLTNRNRSRASSWALQLAKSNPDDDDEDDDEDEDMDIDISNRDWRAFRAQLVMGKDQSDDDGENEKQGQEEGEEDTDNNVQNKNSPASTTSRMTMAIEDGMDLDGIGALFTSPSAPSPMTAENFTPLSPSQWAYDQGKLIEQGAVILGGVEQDYTFGLRQQYFHKVVILVLDHDDTFTKGIILNRPTDLLLKDEFGKNWRMWFGGDVQNLNHPVPDIVCIHTVPLDSHPFVKQCSTTVIHNIQRVSFDDAKQMVQKQIASPSDFWCFAGYAGWGPNQLAGELDRKSWYMCSTDSGTLLSELAKQSAYMDPRDAGLDTWELLMEMIGRGETAQESSGDFEDLMLKEWARAHLLSMEAGGSAGIRVQPKDVAMNQNLVQGETLDNLMKQATASVKADNVGIGSLLRASSNERSPYLLDHQEFHKSIVLVIGDDDNTSVGLILNQPSSKSMEMELVDRKTKAARSVKLPVRFGGQYAIRGKSTVQWLHLNADLREANVGRAVGPKMMEERIMEGEKVDAQRRREEVEVWTCTQDDATSAISAGLAKPSDFLIVSGISVWIKEQSGKYQGIRGEVQNGNFELISRENYGHVWDSLKEQSVLTATNLLTNLDLGNEAWNAGGGASDNDNNNDDDDDGDSDDDDDVPVTGGIGEEYDEEDDRLVFKSDVRVAKLSDDALKSWISTFLLGTPWKML